MLDRRPGGAGTTGLRIEAAALARVSFIWCMALERGKGREMLTTLDGPGQRHAPLTSRCARS
jgi:hypothetical protein